MIQILWEYTFQNMDEDHKEQCKESINHFSDEYF